VPTFLSNPTHYRKTPDPSQMQRFR
jgi:hypothetical protein